MAGTMVSDFPSGRQEFFNMHSGKSDYDACNETECTCAMFIKTKIGNHTFRATGITAYLKNGGRLEIAQQIAAHESSRTTGLYDRRGDEISLDEIERVAI
jgi:hypothetical protein